MKYQSKIAAIGVGAYEFKEENMLILFGGRASGGLEDYSLIIEEPKERVKIECGDTLTIGTQSYRVTAVGEKVEETFSTLGHCTVRFDGATEATLPGTLHLEGDYPEYAVGDIITIE